MLALWTLTTRVSGFLSITLVFVVLKYFAAAFVTVVKDASFLHACLLFVYSTFGLGIDGLVRSTLFVLLAEVKAFG